MIKRGLAAFLGILLLSAWAGDEDDSSNWPQWRGPDRNGVSREVGIPLEWSSNRNILWKLPIEGKGHSSPVVWRDRIFITTDIEGEVIPGAAEPQHIRGGKPYKHPATLSADRHHTLKVLCIDAKQGELLWSRTVHDGQVFDNRHRINTYASPTAVTDGKLVYTYFGSQGVFALNFEGAVIWKIDFGNISTWGHGHGTSPLIYEDFLILQIDQNEGDGSFLVALDKTSGKEAWRTPRQERINYSSPILIGSGRLKSILTTSYHNVIAYDPNDGHELWRTPGFLGNAVPSPVAGEKMVFALSGYPDKLVRAIPIPTDRGGGKIVEPSWEYNKGSGYTPSPLLYGEFLYLVSDKGLLTCLEADSGKVVYEGRRIPTATFVRASPVAWDNKILLSGAEGDFFVIQAGPEHKILGQSSIGERVIASPALAGGRLFIRSEEHLYAIGKK